MRRPKRREIDPVHRVGDAAARQVLGVLQRKSMWLDPFPFNGHTTTCDSIWMGLPVVMLRGNAYA